MRHLFLAILLTLPLAADEKPDAAVDQLLDRIVAREKTFLDTIRAARPLLRPIFRKRRDTTMADAHPNKDHYFLGRFRLGDTVTYEALVDRTEVLPRAGFQAGSVAASRGRAEESRDGVPPAGFRADVHHRSSRFQSPDVRLRVRAREFWARCAAWCSTSSQSFRCRASS